MTWIAVFLVLFGIGCVLGVAWGLIRYGIPTLVWGFSYLIKCSIEGCKEAIEKEKAHQRLQTARQQNQP